EIQGGMPEVGSGARLLGVRPGTDLLVSLPYEIVPPGAGGLSVSPHDAANLPYFRRPRQLGGTGKDPVWVIESSLLRPGLIYRPDPNSPTHGFIEPASSMTLDDYQRALAATQPLWQRVF
ncbi:MAG TPA: hypothetical protein PK867_15395, partial [Pirellulales bacterium]|nr:hypothetical protein [Pirellulales bacterium]